MNILLVDDDRDLVELLDFALRRAGFVVLSALDTATALDALKFRDPSLVILDVNLGASNGFEFLTSMRQLGNNIPVIMLTARDSESDKVLGLELGADDYMTKPFSYRELVARVRAQLRRAGQWGPPILPERSELQVGPLVLNAKEHKVTLDGHVIELTVTEFRLLQFLMVNANTSVPFLSILKQVWGYDDPKGTDVVRVTLHRLRQKLEDDPRMPKLLQSVPGVGVILTTG